MIYYFFTIIGVVVVGYIVGLSLAIAFKRVKWNVKRHAWK